MILINDLSHLSNLNLPPFLIPHIHQRFQQSFPDGYTSSDGVIAIIEPDDTLTSVCPLVGVNLEHHVPEWIEQHNDFYELVFVTGDSGIGADLFILAPIGQSSEWIEYCQRADNHHFLTHRVSAV